MTERRGSSSIAIPEKPYFKIGEVASIVGVKPSVLRYWETEFASLKPEKTRTNQRVYARKVVERVVEIRHLLYDLGFTIAGARKRLREGAPAGEPVVERPPPPGMPDHARRAIEKAKKELREILRLCDE